MDVTLLGTGDATGVPAALCPCELCADSEPRRRPALLVESPGATVVLDVGPDLKAQLVRTDTTDVDAFFLTHFHRDHADGLLELLQTLRSGTGTAWNDDGTGHAFDLYMTDTAVDHLRETFEYHLDTLSPGSPAGGVVVGDLAVRPFPVDHMRPAFETVGFVVDDGDDAVAYAPDMARFVDGPPEADVDLFVVEGSQVVGVGHGPRDDLLNAVDAVDADRTVLVNANEHARGESTASLARRARAVDCELGADFARYRLDGDVTRVEG